MSSAPRFLGLGVALGLTAGLLVGVGLTGPGRAAAAAPLAPLAPSAAATPTAAPSATSGGPDAGTPVALPPVATAGGGAASSGAAIAYPVFGGSPGVAPDHTIVVTGVGQADLTSDGSNRAAAQKTALAAALADARTQADAIAAATGLTISGVLSVNAAVSPSYGVMPMAANGSAMPSCVEVGPGTGGTVAPQAACPPVYRQTLGVSVTVEYRVV